jgi:hypothetical protein
MKLRERYYEIAARYSADLRWITILPRLREMRLLSYNATSQPGLKVIHVRRPDTLSRLWRFLHECGHCERHQKVPNGTPYHQLELEADQYAGDVILAEGLKIPERLLEERRDHVFSELLADLRAGYAPAPGVFAFIEMSETEAEKLVTDLRRLPVTRKFLRGSYYEIQARQRSKTS